MDFRSYTDLRQELKKHHAFGIVSSEASERFRQALLTIKPKFDSGLSEEDEKTYVRDFLNQAFYEGNNAIQRRQDREAELGLLQ